MQQFLNSVIAVCTEKGSVTSSGGVTEEVVFDLGLDGGTGACLKGKFGWLLWTGEL